MRSCSYNSNIQLKRNRYPNNSGYQSKYVKSDKMRHYVHFGTICTIEKTLKTPMEECYF